MIIIVINNGKKERGMRGLCPTGGVFPAGGTFVKLESAFVRQGGGIPTGRGVLLSGRVLLFGGEVGFFRLVGGISLPPPSTGNSPLILLCNLSGGTNNYLPAPRRYLEIKSAVMCGQGR